MGHKTRNARRRMQDAGRLTQDVQHRTLNAERSTQDAQCRTLNAGRYTGDIAREIGISKIQSLKSKLNSDSDFTFASLFGPKIIFFILNFELFSLDFGPQICKKVQSPKSGLEFVTVSPITELPTTPTTSPTTMPVYLKANHTDHFTNNHTN